MSLKSREVAWFGLVFLPLFLALVLLYPIVSPPYQDAVMLVANGALHHFSPYTHVEVETLGGERSSYFRRTITFYFERDQEWQVDWNPLQIHLIFLSLALLPALIGATPIPLRKRFRILGLGLGLLFVAHVITVIALSRCYVCLYDSPDSFSCTLLRRFLNMSGQLFPVILWGFLAWPHLFPRPRPVARVRVEGKLSRNAPCPCGSGRKYKRCCGRAHA